MIKTAGSSIITGVAPFFLIRYHFIEMLLAPSNKGHDGWHERLACVGQRILHTGRHFWIDLAMHQMALLASLAK